MMQPKTVGLYVPEIDSVARDVIDITKRLLDDKNETPADYGQYIQRFALEAIALVAFETRLHILESKPGNKATRLTELVGEMFKLIFRLEQELSLWKLYKTKSFKKMMGVLDEFSR